MKVLVLAPFEAAELERLRAVHEVVYESWMEARRMLSPDDLAERLLAGGFEAVVVEAEFVTRDVVEAVPGLRVVASARGKPVNVDLEAATGRGVVVLQTPGRNAESVADLCLAMILDRARHVSEAAAAVKRGEWSFGLDDDAMVPYIRFRGVELGGRMLGLVGFGAVARAVATRALAFGMVVAAYDPYCEPAVFVSHGVRRAETLEELLRASDALSIHVEQTAETLGMLGEAQLRLLPRGAIVVNTARARVIDQDALVTLLREGHLGGVALDVFAPEPVPPSHPLLAEPGALILPHIGGATADVVRHHSAMIREDMERLARGERPLRCANPAVLDAMSLR
ncbi:MAG TPA: NAD(P)-dependent oxidoreductase [Candidatus Dormibacteraeota bacterium]|nr:NAD(P)-dependent oxidoreductase [Candidatus Dormibacteraeota bacterium]